MMATKKHHISFEAQFENLMNNFQQLEILQASPNASDLALNQAADVAKHQHTKQYMAKKQQHAAKHHTQHPFGGAVTHSGDPREADPERVGIGQFKSIREADPDGSGGDHHQAVRDANSKSGYEQPEQEQSGSSNQSKERKQDLAHRSILFKYLQHIYLLPFTVKSRIL